MDTRIIKEKQDMTYLSWTKIRNSSGTAGSFLKSYAQQGKKKIYYKLSDYDIINGIIGHESVNEVIVDRLLEILGVDHLSYTLIHADVTVSGKKMETYLCASNDFKEKNDSKIALDVYYDTEKQEDENPLEFCIRMGWENYIYEMLVVDFLILNRDRHGANIEILRNSKNKTIKIAPLFDHGLSLLCTCKEEKSVDDFDIMDDKPVQCFVGSRSTKDNLDLIPKNKLPNLNKLSIDHKDILFSNLEGIISQKLQDKIWNMIWNRWCYYEDFCNKK